MRAENPLKNRKIGKIKFMNIDYSSLGHRSRGLAAVELLRDSRTATERESFGNLNSKSLMLNQKPRDKFHSRFPFLSLSHSGCLENNHD